MRILILGASGMLGHKLAQVLRPTFEVWATVRGSTDQGPSTICGVDVSSFDSIVYAFEKSRPEVVVNCVGLVKQRQEANDPTQAVLVNSLFPHRVNRLCGCVNARLIHISTDCVFSGRKGNYREDDIPDATDLYGRSKLLGEVTEHGALTLRTSMIGRELQSKNGLLEWFLSHRGGSVEGYSRAVFSGLPTHELALVISEVIEKHTSLSGVLHVASAPIDKYQLLQLLNDAFDAHVEIRPNDGIVVDRSLDGSRFRELTGCLVKPWHKLVEELAEDTEST